MSPRLAILRLSQRGPNEEAVAVNRVGQSASHEEQTPGLLDEEPIQSSLHNELISAQWNTNENNIPIIQEDPIPSTSHGEIISAQRETNDSNNPVSEKDPLLPLASASDVPSDPRLQWAKSISELFLNRGELDDSCEVRDWDLILNPDGTVETLIDNASSSPLPSTQSSPFTKKYPACYQIPNAILERCSSHKVEVQRAELFALGCILYRVLSGKEMFANIGSGEKVDKLIESYFVKGQFPEDVWELPMAARILGCWCPGFARDLLAAKSNNESFRLKAASYIKRHPILFGLQVAGGIASLASIVALPILGAIGFGALGPVAGSAAAGWQASIGLVEAGSLFAWCQSAAMGGAAVGGILATGLAGAGVAVGATVSGALDNVDTTTPDLREKFLSAWRRDVGEDEGSDEEGSDEKGSEEKGSGPRL